MKRLEAAKQRLAPALPAVRRRRLMEEMAAHVAAEARRAAAGPVAFATSDPAAAELARSIGVEVVSDGGLPWNHGLAHARDLLDPAPAAVLYLAGDLPHLEAGDVEALAAAAVRGTAVIGRAHDGGTNALAVSPAAAMAPGFGLPGSAAAHVRSAEAAGLRAVVLDRPGLALDVDTPADLRHAGLTEKGRALPAG